MLRPPSPSKIEALRRSIGLGRWCLIPSLLDEDVAQQCSDAVLTSENVRRVTVGTTNDSWSECQIMATSLLGGILLSDALREMCAAITGIPYAGSKTTLWGNTYRTGEFIPWHTDTLGSAQLLLNLRQPPAEYGGELQLRLGGDIRIVEWKPGDALLFYATRLPHSTTPISSSDRSCVRITAVARFFA